MTTTPAPTTPEPTTTSTTLATTQRPKPKQTTTRIPDVMKYLKFKEDRQQDRGMIPAVLPDKFADPIDIPFENPYDGPSETDDPTPTLPPSEEDDEEEPENVPKKKPTPTFKSSYPSGASPRYRKRPKRPSITFENTSEGDPEKTPADMGHKLHKNRDDEQDEVLPYINDDIATNDKLEFHEEKFENLKPTLRPTKRRAIRPVRTTQKPKVYEGDEYDVTEYPKNIMDVVKGHRLAPLSKTGSESRRVITSRQRYVASSTPVYFKDALLTITPVEVTSTTASPILTRKRKTASCRKQLLSKVQSRIRRWIHSSVWPPFMDMPMMSIMLQMIQSIMILVTMIMNTLIL